MSNLLSVYDSKEECFILENVSRDEVIKEFGMTPRILSQYISQHYRYMNRYDIFKTDEDGHVVVPKDIQEKWDRIQEAVSVINSGGHIVNHRQPDGTYKRFTEAKK